LDRAREGAQLDRPGAAVTRGVAPLIGLDMSLASIAGCPRPSERVVVIVGLVSLIVERLAQEAGEVRMTVGR
jgi:hypothetical protein